MKMNKKKVFVCFFKREMTRKQRPDARPGGVTEDGEDVRSSRAPSGESFSHSCLLAIGAMKAPQECVPATRDPQPSAVTSKFSSFFLKIEIYV